MGKKGYVISGLLMAGLAGSFNRASAEDREAVYEVSTSDSATYRGAVLDRGNYVIVRDLAGINSDVEIPKADIGSMRVLTKANEAPVASSAPAPATTSSAGSVTTLYPALRAALAEIDSSVGYHLKRMDEMRGELDRFVDEKITEMRVHVNAKAKEMSDYLGARFKELDGILTEEQATERTRILRRYDEAREDATKTAKDAVQLFDEAIKKRRGDYDAKIRPVKEKTDSLPALSTELKVLKERAAEIIEGKKDEN